MAEGLQDHTWARDIQGTIGFQELGEYLLLWRRIEHTELTTEPDRLRWTLTASGTYTAQSAYQATFHGAITCDAWKLTWKGWAPPRVRFFHWLAHLDRCWTAWHAVACSTLRAARSATKHRKPCNISS